MGDEMRVGYSFWGFFGHGITNTPDGGRSHRRPLLDALIGLGHEVVLLQANRDLTEAGDDLTGTYRWDDGLPDLDVLVLEWRWPIPGRNTTACRSAGHTCDLHRQRQLLTHYTYRGLPTVIWDKDLQLPGDDELRQRPNVQIAEAALHPSPGATSLLFPVPDDRLDAADPVALARLPRLLPLVYVGNQYDRDDAFDTYFAPAARVHPHRVAGKWTRTRAWPHVTFTGRIPFSEVEELYRQALTTMLLLPARYQRAGQMTQRLFEAVFGGCLPLTLLTMTTARDADRFAPPELHVRDGAHAAGVIARLGRVAGSSEHVDLLAACLQRLEIFRLSRQVTVFDALLSASRRVHTGVGRR
ncbi:MAG TPA: hypothetical protein VI248_06245 [Kineosporiaceae bacterium]